MPASLTIADQRRKHNAHIHAASVHADNNWTVQTTQEARRGYARRKDNKKAEAIAVFQGLTLNLSQLMRLRSFILADMLGLSLSEMFTNSDEAVINKKLPKELLLRTFSQNCRNIELLSLNGCTKITDSTCNSLSKFCPKLKHLDLASCTSITNLSLKALSEGCPLLEQLNISWCDQVTKDGIQALVRCCPGLKCLFLKGCTQLEDEALKHIGAHCPELVTLNLQTCSLSLTFSLTCSVSARSLLEQYPKQKILYSLFCEQQITDEGLITICRGCHRLQSLCVSGCANITDAILHALGQNCPRLRILEVARCSQLTDVGFTTLARNCHELEKMDLEECVQITDGTLIQLSIHCPRLQVLSLSHCELITDDGIRHLGSGPCAHDRLEVIELDNCPLITDASLEHLKSCHSLDRIELYDCQQITRAGIKRLRMLLEIHQQQISHKDEYQNSRTEENSAKGLEEKEAWTFSLAPNDVLVVYWQGWQKPERLYLVLDVQLRYVLLYGTDIVMKLQEIINNK
ncbi:F-box/LRR-repeat protein 20 F-box and leucine-rich repeat protein 20 [Collichthys lucidus]|uniref:F-box/LRR-repeat protein 20 F-box and leucine-rich repeat protein 20 n=1 Tax=Collichthys lucidus TaxID=240159 RepID=A0A4U5VU43_COLLU|nr:F-box/LRR-repeat protein 20 F-box and leucine-rich repeat protein 20 [Collichthys lucidus]